MYSDFDVRVLFAYPGSMLLFHVFLLCLVLYITHSSFVVNALRYLSVCFLFVVSPLCYLSTCFLFVVCLPRYLSMTSTRSADSS